MNKGKSEKKQFKAKPTRQLVIDAARLDVPEDGHREAVLLPAARHDLPVVDALRFVGLYGVLPLQVGEGLDAGASQLGSG